MGRTVFISLVHTVVFRENLAYDAIDADAGVWYHWLKTSYRARIPINVNVCLVWITEKTQLITFRGVIKLSITGLPLDRTAHFLNVYS